MLLSSMICLRRDIYMKSRRNIKNTFKKIGKLSVITFFVTSVIMVCFVLTSQEEEVVEIPTLLGILFGISMVAFLICIVIAWILDLIEGMRTNKVSYLKEFVMQIVVFSVVFVVMDYFIDKISGNWIGYLARVTGTLCGLRGVEYIWSKKD